MDHLSFPSLGTSLARRFGLRVGWKERFGAMACFKKGTITTIMLEAADEADARTTWDGYLLAISAGLSGQTFYVTHRTDQR